MGRDPIHDFPYASQHWQGRASEYGRRTSELYPRLARSGQVHALSPGWASIFRASRDGGWTTIRRDMSQSHRLCSRVTYLYVLGLAFQGHGRTVETTSRSIRSSKVESNKA
jgi:hypothetical protein